MSIKVNFRKGEITTVSHGNKKLTKSTWARGVVKGPVVAVQQFSLVRLKMDNGEFQYWPHWWPCWLWRSPSDPFTIYFNPDGEIDYLKCKECTIKRYAVDLNQIELKDVTLSVIHPFSLIKVTDRAKSFRWGVCDRHGNVWI